MKLEFDCGRLVSDVKYEYLSAKVLTPNSLSASLKYTAIPTLFFIYYINIL